ncbi:hypothetical protein NG754_10400 [Aliarcobacter cryaerophilus]|jgi:hypothetical protein|uniref:Uncharacterized protein n=1 Tax=Aliarcobacter cryaerophilus TaxID=28198 RepID=A0A2S9T4V9_9BACT|nr:hypothetical protein [Aliarcobacter cryaerophilus]PRM93874.1 hypothetical protein CJ673_07810 [Aliarcobacter cryaerophilus]
MRSLRVEVSDTIFERVIAFFNKLPKRDIKLAIDENDKIYTPKQLSSLSIKTKGFKFNREEANER